MRTSLLGVVMRKRVILLVGALGGIAVLLGAQEIRKGLRPAVERRQFDGGAYYEKIILTNATLGFFERPNELHCYSEHVEYTMYLQETGRLARFELRLTGQLPAKAGLEPLKQTGYVDVDGDGVFDVMGRDRGRYILYRDTWTKVGSRKSGLYPGSEAVSDETGDRYVFKTSKWELVAKGNRPTPDRPRLP